MIVNISNGTIISALAANYNISCYEAKTKFNRNCFSQRDIRESLTYFIKYKNGVLT